MSLVEGSDPMGAGALSAATSRQVASMAPDTGVLATGPAGLMQDYTDFFELSPANTGVSSPVSALDDWGTGSGEVVWAGIPGGAARLSGAGSTTYSIQGESGSPSAVLQVDPSLALLAFGGTVYALRYTEGGAESWPHDFGSIAVMARGGAGAALLAGEQGLFVRAPSGEVAHHAVGAVSGLVYDPINGAFAATDHALLLRHDDGRLEQVGQFQAAGPHPLAIDGFGDVWAASGPEDDPAQTSPVLLQFRVGSPVSYVNDVKPFFAAHCYACHVTGTQQNSPRLPLDDYDGTRGLLDTLLQRVTNQGGSPMPPPPPLGEGALSPSQYGVLVRWARSGEQP
jgi:hypothetical protein